MHTIGCEVFFQDLAPIYILFVQMGPFLTRKYFDDGFLRVLNLNVEPIWSKFWNRLRNNFWDPLLEPHQLSKSCFLGPII